MTELGGEGPTLAAIQEGAVDEGTVYLDLGFTSDEVVTQKGTKSMKGITCEADPCMHVSVALEIGCNNRAKISVYVM